MMSELNIYIYYVVIENIKEKQNILLNNVYVLTNEIYFNSLIHQIKRGNI